MVTLAGELVTKKKIITSTLDYVIAPQFGSRDHCYKTFQCIVNSQLQKLRENSKKWS